MSLSAPSPSERSLRWSAAVFAAGFAALAAQVLLLRELIFALGCNEPFIGVMLAAWLAWTALGSGLRLGRHARLAPWLVLMAAGFAASVTAARLSRLVFGLTPGEVPVPAQITLAAAASTALFAFPSGRVFAILVSLGGGARGASLSRAYMLEAAGACAGGLLTSLVLLGRFAPAAIAGTGAALLVGVAAAFAGRRSVRTALAAIALISGAAALTRGAAVDQSLTARLYPGFETREVRHSPYGSLAALEREGSLSIFESGSLLLLYPDPQTAEEAAHLALSQHPAPSKVLMLGGGLQGGVLEAVRHPSVARLDYVELDAAVFDLARSRLPDVWQGMFSDPRIRIHAADGRAFLRGGGEPYDVIILNLPPPATLMLNRFYTAGFFHEAHARLSPSGVLSIRLPGGENFIGEARAAVLRCAAASLREAFHRVAALPGESVHLFGLREAAEPALSAADLLSRLSARGIELQYLGEHMLPFRLSPGRISALESRLEGEAPVNRDFRPVATHLEALAWGARAGPFRPWIAGAALAMAAVLAAVLGGVFRRGAPVACVGATGLSVMVLQVLLVAAFQAVRGSLYRDIAILMAAFMAGMAAGAALGLRAPEGRDRLRLAWLQAGVLAVGPGAIAAVNAYPQPLAFGVAIAVCGLLAGLQFAVAARLDAARGQAGARPGALYAADLAGACGGALLAASAVLPVYGFLWTAALVAALNIMPAAWAFFSAKTAFSGASN